MRRPDTSRLVVFLAVVLGAADCGAATSPEECRSALERLRAASAALREARATSAPIPDLETLLRASTAETEVAESAKVVPELDANAARLHKLGRLVLRGVARQEGRTVAVINDQVLQVGGAIDGFRIVYINADVVVLEDDAGVYHELVLNADLMSYDHKP